MSRISENIRKITKAWGGKTTGNGISDALSDLYNNLPFGVKTEMVEIVPEQSVTIVDATVETTNVINENCKTVTENTNMYLSIDGKEMKCNFVGVQYGNLGFMTEDEKIVVVLNPLSDDDYMSVGLTDMSGEYEGKTITVKVFEKSEVATPIPAKFLPPIFVVTVLDGVADKTYDEILNAFKNGSQVYLSTVTGEYFERRILSYIDDYEATFRGVRPSIVDGTNMEMYEIKIYSHGEVEENWYNYKMTLV